MKEGSKKYRKVGPYLLMNVIGKGAYSTVYEARKEGEKKRYAVKQISLVTVSSKQLQRIHLEVRVLTHMKHPNIVCLLDYKQTSRNLYLVFEYCKNTDLDAFIQKCNQQRLPEEKVRKIAIQIKNAFQALRANKVVHRDLKLANILITEDFQIKIADFGFAKYLDDDEFFKSYVGTPLTMAPQIFQNQSYNEKCDLWSLGIILYQLLFGKNPFFTKDKMTKDELKKAIRAELKIPDTISQTAKDILKKLIVRQPTERISFQDFFKHQWLASPNASGHLHEDLMEEALKIDLTKAISGSVKKKEEKDFLLSNTHHLLSYELIQIMKNSIQGKIMYWINLGKRIMSMQYKNTKLSFLAVALLMENLEKCQSCPLSLIVNQSSTINFGKYSDIRKMIKWEMSEYTKRLPGFIERSLSKMTEYLKVKKQKITNFEPAQKSTQILQLYLFQLVNETLREVSNMQSLDDLSIFIKIRPFTHPDFSVKANSSIFNEDILSMIIKKSTLNIENNKMYKKCAGIFKLETMHKEYPDDCIYDNLKQILQ